MARKSSITAEDMLRFMYRDTALLFDALVSGDAEMKQRAIEHHEDVEKWLGRLELTKSEKYDTVARSSPPAGGRPRVIDVDMPKRCRNVFDRLGIEYLDEVRNFTPEQCFGMGNCSRTTIQQFIAIITSYGLTLKPTTLAEVEKYREHGLL